MEKITIKLERIEKNKASLHVVIPRENGYSVVDKTLVIGGDNELELTKEDLC